MFEKFGKNLSKTNGTAYLNANTQHKILILKGKFRAEFQEGERVELYFDKDSFSIGMVKGEHGYSIRFAGGQLAVTVTALCKHYNITGKYYAQDFTKEGEMYVVKLEKF